MEKNIYVDMCEYLQPLVNSCSGFIKTKGYITHIPGVVLLMSADETFFSIINIPVIFNITFTANINKFLFNKEEELQKNILSNTYFLGNNQVYMKMIRYYDMYRNATYNTIYHNDNCLDIPGYYDGVIQSDIKMMNIITINNRFMVPVSKAITPLNKGDECSITIYDYIYQDIIGDKATVKYQLYKKKFKIMVEIFFNILKL